MPLHDQTLNAIAEFICGDVEVKYRSSSHLTDFFRRVGLSHFEHDGSTRKIWVYECLKKCSREEQALILKQLASPREYGGDKEKIKKALQRLNEICALNEFEIYLDGIEAKLRKIKPNYNVVSESSTSTEAVVHIPDFTIFSNHQEEIELLEKRWSEAQLCINFQAYLSAIILMGSILEALLLITLKRFPKESNTCSIAPKDKKTNKSKQFSEWKLSEMIEVAHHLRWINSDRKEYSHALRDFRNLIHPREQIKTQIYPDYNTCKISFHVLEATVQDLSIQISKK